MKIKDIMTLHPKYIGPDTTVKSAAEIMCDLDIGSLPVCENDHLVGMLTDRDITIRGVAQSRDPDQTPVRAIMSAEVAYAFVDQDLEEATRLMEVKQVRRLPIVDHDKRLVGILSLGDMAVLASVQLSGEALKEISEPVPAII